MQTIDSLQEFESTRIGFDSRWTNEMDSLLMHSIHAYPAKFPSFLVSNAFDYAIEEGVKVSSVADIFCGCGTTALESKRRDIQFWGCDINPVAVLITQAKTANYNLEELKNDFNQIISKYNHQAESKDHYNAYNNANERLKYWYNQKSYNDLHLLYSIIKEILATKTDEEQVFFSCLFSAILKQCSRWLQKSIKPQVDPHKKDSDVIAVFKSHFKSIYSATEQLVNKTRNNVQSVTIKQENFLECPDLPNVDLIITSPPYVTSYEYADLHQLSSLWLNYADDYRDLRKGSIGSSHVTECREEKLAKLNKTATGIVTELDNKGYHGNKKQSVATYYFDMQKAIQRCYSMLNNNGMAIFVIGDSEKDGVKLKNTQHLIESMFSEGFTDIKISKRQITKGICVPYRDEKGKFTRKKDLNKIYHEEYIISGRKKATNTAIAG